MTTFNSQSLQNILQFLFHAQFWFFRGPEPILEAPEGGCRQIRISSLLSLAVATLQEFVLVMRSPDNFQIAVDVQVVFVLHVEVLKPTAQRFPATVSRLLLPRRFRGTFS